MRNGQPSTYDSDHRWLQEPCSQECRWYPRSFFPWISWPLPDPWFSHTLFCRRRYFMAWCPDELFFCGASIPSLSKYSRLWTWPLPLWNTFFQTGDSADHLQVSSPSPRTMSLYLEKTAPCLLKNRFSTIQEASVHWSRSTYFFLLLFYVNRLLQGFWHFFQCVDLIISFQLNFPNFSEPSSPYHMMEFE